MNPDKIKKRIQNELHISEDQYLNYAYEAGLAYLESRRDSFYKRFPGECDKIDSFIRRLVISHLWWNWWMEEWKAVDSQFLLVTPINIDFYLSMHVSSSKHKAPPNDIVEQIFELPNKQEALIAEIPTNLIRSEIKIHKSEMA